MGKDAEHGISIPLLDYEMLMSSVLNVDLAMQYLQVPCIVYFFVGTLLHKSC